MTDKATPRPKMDDNLAANRMASAVRQSNSASGDIAQSAVFLPAVYLERNGPVKDCAFSMSSIKPVRNDDSAVGVDAGTLPFLGGSNDALNQEQLPWREIVQIERHLEHMVHGDRRKRAYTAPSLFEILPIGPGQFRSDPPFVSWQV